MSLFDKSDEFNPLVLPTRFGGTAGRPLENRMLDKVGGAATLRTEIRTLPDGSEVMLRTRNGFPEFTLSAKKASPVELSVLTFQGLSISAGMPYGCVLLEGGGISAADANANHSSLLWSMAAWQNPVPLTALTTKADGYKGNMDWRDTRTPAQTSKIVTWRGLGALARNTPHMCLASAPANPAPFDTYSDSTYDGKVWVDGTVLPVIPNGRVVLCAAIYNNGQSEQVRAVCFDRTGYLYSYGGFVYGTTGTLYLYTFQLVGGLDWGYVGAASFSGGATYLWQPPVFNSSGTEFCGLYRQGTAGSHINEYPETEYTVTFATNPTITVTEGSEVGSHSSYSDWLGVTSNYTKTILAIDYVGDTKQRLTYGTITHNESLTIPATTTGFQGTDTWQVIADWSFSGELQAIAAAYGHTLASLSSAKLVRPIYTGRNGYIMFYPDAAGVLANGGTYLVAPFGMKAKAPYAGDTQKTISTYTSIKRFYSSNGLLQNNLHTVRTVTAEYSTFFTASCTYAINVVEVYGLPGTLDRIEVIIQQNVTEIVVTPETDVTQIITAENTEVVTSIDLRSRTYTKTANGASTCELYQAASDPGIGVGEGVSYTITQPSKSNTAAFPTLPLAPRNHASHPAGGAAVITRSDADITEFVSSFGSTDIGVYGCATGMNKTLTSPIFFRRTATP